MVKVYHLLKYIFSGKPVFHVPPGVFVRDIAVHNFPLDITYDEHSTFFSHPLCLITASITKYSVITNKNVMHKYNNNINSVEKIPTGFLLNNFLGPY